MSCACAQKQTSMRLRVCATNTRERYWSPLRGDLLDELRTASVVVHVLSARNSAILQPAVRPIVDSIAPRKIRIMCEWVTATIESSKCCTCIRAISQRVGNNSGNITRTVVCVVLAEVFRPVPCLDNGLAGSVGGGTVVGHVGCLSRNWGYKSARNAVSFHSNDVDLRDTHFSVGSAIAPLAKMTRAEKVKRAKFGIISIGDWLGSIESMLVLRRDVLKTILLEWTGATL